MAMSETMREIRLPWMMRLRTSRPKRSVPSGCSHSPRSIHRGGISFWVMSPAVGLCGAREDANTAVKTSAASTRPGNQGTSSLAARMTDPRVEIAVQQVHEKIPGEIEGAQHQDSGLHDGIVTRGDALENQSSQARPREHGLRDHGAAQELHEEHDREGDDGQEGVLQAVLPEHDLVVQPLESRELDVVRPEHLQHGRARQPHDGGGREVPERERGEDQVQRPAAAPDPPDRKSTRLNSSHLVISYAVFCLKKKKKKK